MPAAGKVTLKFVNRGPAGLLNTPLGKPTREVVMPEVGDGTINRIAKDLLPLVIPINKPIHDPRNARLHPEKNMRAIKDSLRLYGQRTPIVVNRRTGHVMKGNGTLAAARELGWTVIAVVWEDDDEVTAAAYGLADNRTSELATWDTATVTALDRLIAEACHPMVGWTMEELAAIRKIEFTAPPGEFPTVDEDIETHHQCPKCGYKFSGCEKQGAADDDVAGDEGPELLQEGEPTDD